MKTQWLFESDIFDEGIDRLVDEVRRQGMTARIASYVPAQSGTSYLDLFEPRSCVVFHGSLNFATQIAREASWIPGLYYSRSNYACTEYYPRLGRFLLAQDYVMLPYGDLIRQKRFLFEHLGEDGSIFVRPDAVNKVFSGQLTEESRFERDVEKMGFYDVRPGELCVVSRPRNIIGEWRFVAVDGRIIAGSQYRIEGRRDVIASWPGQAWELAQCVAASGWQPDRAWTIDICRTRVGFYLLEIGTLSCAGLYACDPEEIVREVSRVAVEDWADRRIEG